MENVAAGPTLPRVARIAAARLLLASGCGGACRAWSPTAISTRPSPRVTTDLKVSCASRRSTKASPSTRPTTQAMAVPITKPLRKAIPFLRGRSLRRTRKVAARIMGLRAAQSA